MPLYTFILESEGGGLCFAHRSLRWDGFVNALCKKRSGFGLVLSIAALLCGPARADSWLPPSTHTYLSADGQWRLTVVPRGISSPLSYFEDKVAAKPKPGGEPGSVQQPLGQMEHRLQDQWEVVWTAPLVNETAPVGAMVSAQGLAVSFDNWHSVGYGGDVVVIYDRMGRKVRALALEDFLPKDYLRALPTSISSRWWGSEHKFSPDGHELILRVVVPRMGDGPDRSPSPEPIQVKLEMATGRVLPLEGLEWERALTAARAVDAERTAQEARRSEAFKAPLAAPVSTDERAWHEYLVEAFFRVDPDTDVRYPNIGVVAAGGPESGERDQQLVRKVLLAAIEDYDEADEYDGVVMLGCPDQAQLIRALAKVAVDLPPHALRRVRVYVTVTPALREAAAQALASSGAKVVALDVSAKIPQSAERLKRATKAMTGSPE